MARTTTAKATGAASRAPNPPDEDHIRPWGALPGLAVVPARLCGFLHPTVGPEREESVKTAGEPAVVGHRHHRALEGIQTHL